MTRACAADSWMQLWCLSKRWQMFGSGEVRLDMNSEMLPVSAGTFSTFFILYFVCCHVTSEWANYSKGWTSCCERWQGVSDDVWRINMHVYFRFNSVCLKIPGVLLQVFDSDGQKSCLFFIFSFLFISGLHTLFHPCFKNHTLLSPPKNNSTCFIQEA